MGARETALNALITCRRYEGWSNAVLKDCIRRDKLDARDAALATRLCYGVVQNRGKLDFYLAQLLKGSLKKLHPAVRDILHMGLYQLLELDKIPDSAAVNESVRLARKYGPAGCEKLVNAVLRNAARSKDTLAQPTSFEDKYSHPAELVALLKTALPKGTLESVLQADNQAPETVIQVNTLKTDQEALKKRLSLVPEGTAQKKAAEAQLSEEEAAAQDAEMSGGAETVAEAADNPVETAAVRLGQKLGLGATQEDDGSERETAFSADLAGTAAANAALLRAREAESADNASDWIRKLLSADGRDGASAAAARGKNDFSLAQEQEVRETESFSLSLERDARRYDGGFLFY